MTETKDTTKKTRTVSRRSSSPRAEKEFDQVIVDIARVTRVMAGGKRMRFRACVVIGDRKGRIGSAVAKAADVASAVNKAATKARKNLFTVPIVNGTIPHAISMKQGAAKILLKPAPKGSGIIAGGAVRIVVDLAGISNVVAKIFGSNNKLNNVRATMAALKALKRVEKIEKKIEDKKESKIEIKEDNA